MSAEMNKLAKSLNDAINEANAKKTRPYDVTASVVRIEGNTAWVKIPGGVSETPVEKTINASEGDVVKVRISGGRAWLTGNGTAPPTDDTTAIEAKGDAAQAAFDAYIANLAAKDADASAKRAQVSANDAHRAADIAWDYAADANSAAVNAHNYAGDAYNQANLAMQEASRAQQEADNASSSAYSANTSANAALLNLSTIENVIDTLGWMYDHGYFTYCASDVDPVQGKVYYILEGTAVSTPTGSPEAQGFYEISTVDQHSIYIKSTDTAVVSGKAYYTVSAVTVQDPESPSANDYYELIMDQAVSDYVSTHLAMDSRGLWLIPRRVTPEATGIYKVLISAEPGYEGVTIFGPDGIAIAKYGAESIIGKPDSYHIEIRSSGSEARLAFCNGENEVAYINNQQLYITKTVVLNEMQLSDKWIWKYDASDDSIYLKWMGGEVI